MRAWADSLAGALPTRDGLWVEWQVDGTRDARVTSAFTRVLLSKWPGPVDWATEWKTFCATLDLRLIERRPLRRDPPTSGLQWLVLGAADHAVGLPGALFCHVAGIHHLTPMTKTSVARLATGRRVATMGESSRRRAADEDDQDLAMAVAQAALSMPRRAGPLADWRDEALRAFPGPGETGTGLRERTAVRVRRLLVTHQPRGRIAGLMIGWLLHMLAFGTVSRERPALSTVRGYFRQVTRLALDADEAIEVLLQDDLERIEARYVEWQEMTGWNSDVGAGLASLDQFLADLCGRPCVRVLRRAGSQDVARSGPDSRVLTAVEIEQACSLLAETMSGRLGTMAVTMVRLAAALPLRPTELVRIRVGQVRVNGASMFIDIRHDRRLGRLKTSASARTLALDDLAAAELVRAWRDLRVREGAPHDAPLFGDALDVRGAQDLAAAQLQIQRVLREVTGDAGIRVYALRHSCITRLLAEAFSPARKRGPFDPLLQMAALAGHAGPGTTLMHYFHAHPWLLRQWLDEGLASALTVRAAAALAGIDENTLGRRIGRQPDRRTSILVKALAESVHDRQFAGWEDSGLLAPSVSGREVVVVRPAAKALLIEPREVFELWCAEARGRDAELLAGGVGLTDRQWRRLCQLRQTLGEVLPWPVRASWWQLAKLRPVAQAMQQQGDPEALARALRSWRSCQGGRHLDATDGNRLDALLWWMWSAGLRSTQIVMRVTDAGQTAIDRLEDQIVSIFKAPPSIERLRRRAGGGRPALHLAIAERLPEAGRPHAEPALSMTGFRALMAAAWASLALSGVEV